MSSGVVSTVDKLADDDSLDREWVLPAEAVEAVANLLGGLVDSFPVTSEIAMIVQPWVDEAIDPEAGCWFLSAYSVDGGQPVA